MSRKSIKCPNCNGPVKPNQKDPTLSCGYCNHHFENPVYRAPRASTPVGGGRSAVGTPKISRRVLVIILVASLLPILVGLVFALGVATRISRQINTIPPLPCEAGGLFVNNPMVWSRFTPRIIAKTLFMI